MFPGGGALERLPLFVGRARALEIILGSDDFDAETAARRRRLASWFLTEFQLAALPAEPMDETTFVTVRAVPGDSLRFYDSLHENTAYPVDLLWGPGTQPALQEWAATAEDRVDTVDYLDRLFLVRVQGRAVRPAVAAGLSADGRPRDWQVVRANHPEDASRHARSAAAAAGRATRDPAACAATPSSHRCTTAGTTSRRNGPGSSRSSPCSDRPAAGDEERPVRSRCPPECKTRGPSAALSETPADMQSAVAAAVATAQVRAECFDKATARAVVTATSHPFL
jgi:hypothetical protein